MVKRTPRAILLCLVALASMTALDLWTKSLAQRYLSREIPGLTREACEPDEQGRVSMQRGRVGQLVLIENYLELRYTENCGAAFGMLNDAPRWLRYGLFMTAAGVAVILLLGMFARGSGGPLFAFSVPFIASGALGNLVDRVQHVYVVDFIRFHIGNVFEWPTFNVADSTITVGVVLLLIDGFRGQPTPAPEEQPVSGDRTG
ncbi:MAG: signal peptidase II [Anaerolineae bacterium]